jgi:diguanylate cyclase (GGDEF)-like protein
MTIQWLAPFSPAQKRGVLGLSLLAVAIIGLGDYITGFEIALTTFYLIPVGVAAWIAGRGAGFLVAIASAMVWLWADLQSGRPYGHPAIPPWNAFVRLSSFSVVAFTLASLRKALVQAHTDELTRIPNTRAFIDRLDVELRRARRYGRALTVAYLDIDGFKNVNGQYGHRAGDELLQLVAKTLEHEIRSSDMAARLGGDEFSILFAETDFADAAAALAHLRVALDDAMHAAVHRVSFSIGAVTLVGFTEDPQIVIDAADALMYEAKRNPGNAIRHERLP